MFKVDKQLSKMKTALAMNIAIVVFTILGVILLFGKLDPFDFPGLVNSAEPLKYFTTLSNLLMALISILMIVIIGLYLSKKIKTIPKAFYILDFTGVVGVALTLLTVVFFLAPLTLIINSGAEFNFDMMFAGSNFIFHIATPIASIVSFVAFFSTKEIKLPEILYGLIPMFLYSIFYMSVALTHVNPDGTVPVEYDWYRFCILGVKFVPLVLVIMYGLTFLIAWLLWLGNRKIQTKKIHFEFTLNIAIFLFALVAMVWCVILHGEIWYYWTFFLTQISTIFMGTVSFIYIIYLGLLQSNKIMEIPNEIRVLKLSATTTSAIVFIFVLFFGVPFYSDNKWLLLTFDGLFTHLLIPCFSVLSYICVEHTPKMKFKYIWWVILLPVLYSFFYIGMTLPHLHSDWTSDPYYDWYTLFIRFKYGVIAMPFVMAGFSFLFGWLLWLLNRNIHPGLPKAPRYQFNKKVNH